MAQHNATCTSIIDLITQLNTYLKARGWTGDHLDVTATASTGGEWAMTKDNIRFAASWDSANSGTNLALYQYSDQAYVIGDRPWGQDHDSGNGAAGTLDADIIASRHVKLAAAPIQFWVFDPALAATESYAHIIVEVSTGKFVHFGFGSLTKKGDWTGGEYCYGQFDNNTGITSGTIAVDGASFLLDGYLNDGSGIVDAELYAATIHCEGLPNQTANGMWAVSVGGSDSGGSQATLGNDRQSNDGVSSDTARHMFFDGVRSGPYANGYARSSGVDLGGEMRMWPIAPRYYDSTTGAAYGPMGIMPNVFACVIPGNVVTGQEFTDGTDTYTVLPADFVWESGGNGSGMLGIAYKHGDAETSLAPGDFAALSAHWDASDVANLTLEDNGRVSTWDDLSAGGHDLLQTTDANRPIWFTDPVTGLDAIRFKAASDHYLSVVSHADLDVGTGDMLINIVYRQDTKAAGALMAKGNTATVSARWVARTDGTGDSDTDSGFELEHNDNVASGDVTNTESTQDWCEGGWTLLTYLIDQTSGSLARIWKDGVEIGSGTDISTVTTLLNTQPLLVGVEESTAFANAFDGEIGEISMIQENPGDASIDLLNTYFINKWFIGTDSYVDPGLPSSVSSNVTGWYSSRSSDDYTEVSGEVTVWADKSANANDVAPVTTGPGLRKVRGLNWMNFESTTPTELSGTNDDINPDGGDFSCVILFRSSNTAANQGLFYKEQVSNQYLGYLQAFSGSGRSLRWAMRDTVFANTLALDHDPGVGYSYADGQPKLSCFTYDDSIADAFLYGHHGSGLGENDAQDEVMSDTAYASANISSTGTFRIGEWASSSNVHFDGQIAEIIFFDIPLSDAERAEVYDYLYTKWNLTEYYTDPGLPSAVATPSARYDAHDTTDLTLSGSQITQWDDKVAGTLNFTVPATKTGPAHRWIRGRMWAHFENGSGWVLSQATDGNLMPVATDHTVVVVYKAEDHTTTGSLFGSSRPSGGSNNQNYTIAINTSGEVVGQTGTHGSTTAVVVDTGVVSDDSDARIARMHYDNSTQDLYLYANDPTDISTQSDADTAANPGSSIQPDADVYMGEWNDSYALDFLGQIAEVIIFKSLLGASAVTALQTYLSEKWGVEL